MQSNELTNDGCNGINGTITKNNTDDNCNMETKITMVNDNGTTGNNDASVPSTKVDVEPINNKDGVERNSERSCEGDDVITSPPIKLRIRQSFHDGTLDDGINNGASTKVQYFFNNSIENYLHNINSFNIIIPYYVYHCK